MSRREVREVATELGQDVEVHIYENCDRYATTQSEFSAPVSLVVVNDPSSYSYDIGLLDEQESKWKRLGDQLSYRTSEDVAPSAHGFLLDELSYASTGSEYWSYWVRRDRFETPSGARTLHG